MEEVEKVLHGEVVSVFCFNFQYPHFSLRSSSICLRLLLPRISINYVLFPKFLSIKCPKRQSIPKIRSIRIYFLPSIYVDVDCRAKS
jgi:hypothetical protein